MFAGRDAPPPRLKRDAYSQDLRRLWHCLIYIQEANRYYRAHEFCETAVFGTVRGDFSFSTLTCQLPCGRS
jgi:hypothetical protein